MPAAPIEAAEPAAPIEAVEPAAPIKAEPAASAAPVKEVPAAPEVAVEAKSEPVTPPKEPRACKDGELLRDGCRCDGKRCMDICCVGSVCSHHASPDRGYAKCMKVRR